MSDDELSSRRVNAERLVRIGLPSQVTTASDIIPLIDAEATRRAALSGIQQEPRLMIPGNAGHDGAHVIDP